MNDRDALLEAIRKHPAEDTPRLMYADWLEDNLRGPEAEFIRLGCGLGEPNPRTARAKERAWFTANWPLLLPELAVRKVELIQVYPHARFAERTNPDRPQEIPTRMVLSARVDRGFVTHISAERTTLAAWLFLAAETSPVATLLVPGGVEPWTASTFAVPRLPLETVPTLWERVKGHDTVADAGARGPAKFFNRSNAQARAVSAVSAALWEIVNDHCPATRPR